MTLLDIQVLPLEEEPGAFAVEAHFIERGEVLYSHDGAVLHVVEASESPVRVDTRNVSGFWKIVDVVGT